MDQDWEECAKVFLEEQGKLFHEPVAETLEEAKEFLEDCFTQVFHSLQDVKEYLSELGMDADGMSLEEVEESLEVFKISGGKYFVVEA